jgi:1-acyl-sn-glycerol-3-phosphate acyltransferase
MSPLRTEPIRDPLEDEGVTSVGGNRSGAARAGAGGNGLLQELGDIFVFWSGCFLFAASTFATSVFGACLSWVLPRAIGARLGKRVIMAVFRANLAYLRFSGRFELDLRALDALRADGGLVIAPNHPALLDVLLVVSRLPRITCIMKAELWDNLLLGGGARLAGYIRNDSPRSMVKLAVEEIGRGSQLLVFPEGTRTIRSPVNRFKPGFALIARRAGVPVQTVFIETNSPFLGKGWRWWRRPAFPIWYRVRLGRRFAVDGDAKTFSAMLEGYFEDELRGSSVAGRDV